MALLVLIVLWAGWVRTHGITRTGFSPDEEITRLAVQAVRDHGLPQLPSGEVYVRGIAYTYAAWAAGSILGHDLPSYRWPSWIFGLATMLIIFLIAHQSAGPVVALAALAMVAVSDSQIMMSKWARFYTQFHFFYFLTLLLAMRRNWRDSPRLRLAAGASMVMCILSARLGVTLLALPVFEYLRGWWGRRGASDPSDDESGRTGLSKGTVLTAVGAFLLFAALAMVAPLSLSLQPGASAIYAWRHWPANVLLLAAVAAAYLWMNRLRLSRPVALYGWMLMTGLVALDLVDLGLVPRYFDHLRLVSWLLLLQMAHEAFPAAAADGHGVAPRRVSAETVAVLLLAVAMVVVDNTRAFGTDPLSPAPLTSGAVPLTIDVDGWQQAKDLIRPDDLVLTNDEIVGGQIAGRVDCWMLSEFHPGQSEIQFTDAGQRGYYRGSPICWRLDVELTVERLQPGRRLTMLLVDSVKNTSGDWDDLLADLASRDELLSSRTRHGSLTLFHVSRN